MIKQTNDINVCRIGKLEKIYEERIMTIFTVRSSVRDSKGKTLPFRKRKIPTRPIILLQAGGNKTLSTNTTDQ